jgi:hypothetical protein
MEKIINLLIKEFIEGVDTYTHNGSTWLIFTESKQWVIELTESRTLWYNYNFFKEIFEYTSMDVVENQRHITKWVEDNIINKVKETNWFEGPMYSVVDNVIDDGINHTEIGWHQCNNVDDTIEKGVKETKRGSKMNDLFVEDTIQNGVKNSIPRQYVGEYIIDKIIDKGIIDTIDCDWDVPTHLIEDVINDGVKETKTPGKDGDILGVMDWMEENKTNSVPKMIDDIIENGVKQTKYANRYDSIGPVFKEGKIENIIENGVKISGTFVGGKRQKENIESVIGYGTKNPTG